VTIRESVNPGFRPLRLSFGRRRQEASESQPAEIERAVPDVEFIAYALDCTLSGRLAFEADRLSDLINDHEELELADVVVADLVGGSGRDIDMLRLSRDEILAVHAAGPRGRPDKRRNTRQHPIIATLGPYLVRGFVHAMPGAEPIASLRGRRPMIAVTDAVIEYMVGRELIRHRVSTLLVNRELIDEIVAGVDGSDALDRVSTTESGALSEDFTGRNDWGA